MTKCAAVTSKQGYRCPVRGCDKKHNRLFTINGLVQHIRCKHGREELEKRLRIKYIEL